jgi:hypothetical protein
MFDKGKVLGGIFIFLLCASLPFLFVPARQKDMPELKLPEKEKACIEERLFMREKHMRLLSLLRDEKVRHGERFYKSRDGRVFEVDLSGTCMRCHERKEEFCDRCHGYMGVKPDCFFCHNYRRTGT